MITATRTIIREATEADVAPLVAMGLRFAADTYAGRLLADAGSLERLGRWLMQAGVLFVADRDGKPVGMIGMIVVPHPMSGILTGMEAFWWVEPDARGHGLRLLRAAERWAKDRGAVALQVVAPNDEVSELYARLGYEKIETAFSKRI